MFVNVFQEAKSQGGKTKGKIRGVNRSTEMIFIESKVVWMIKFAF